MMLAAAATGDERLLKTCRVVAIFIMASVETSEAY